MKVKKSNRTLFRVSGALTIAVSTALLGLGLIGASSPMYTLRAQSPVPVIPEPDLSVARGLLNMPVEEANEAIKKFNAKEAEILNTQLLALIRPRNPDVDRVYGLIRHLESLRADAQAQNRLDTLLYVLALTLLLFTGFLIYVIIDQRRSLRELQKLLTPGSASTQDNSSQNVYRGE
ncbi:MAG: hypothetical protein NXI24_15235 [bacterium]|nr:hypothetical protein [bacterium]